VPIYEFQCAKEHVTEELCSIGTDVIVCPTCFELMKAAPPLIPHDVKDLVCNVWNPLAHRILSATKTDFHFADPRR